MCNSDVYLMNKTNKKYCQQLMKIKIKANNQFMNFGIKLNKIHSKITKKLFV